MSDWPVTLEGVTETVVTTRGPKQRWNGAALGIHAGEPVVARTWGKTRTRQNFERQQTGYVQFVVDPVVFTKAALGIHEIDDPILPSACAWAKVTVTRYDSGTSDGTEWVDWRVVPQEKSIRERRVPTLNRGRSAVIEATVAASRLEVTGYERETLVSRLTHLAGVVERCGTDQDRAAMKLIPELSTWDPSSETPIVGSNGNESF